MIRETSLQPSTWWAGKREELIERMEAEGPAEFLTWPTITSTMFVGDAPYIAGQYMALLMSGEAQRWMDAIREPGVGNPEYLAWDEHTSGNLVHQAYHLHRWERRVGRRIDELEGPVVEFGGGYGALAVVAYQAGYRGEWVIYDFPEYAALANWYLEACGVDDARAVSEIADLPEGTQMVAGICSLSEAPIAARDRFLFAIGIGDARHVLIRYQIEWDGVDNEGYFAPIAGTRERDGHTKRHRYLLR